MDQVGGVNKSGPLKSEFCTQLEKVHIQPGHNTETKKDVMQCTTVIYAKVCISHPGIQIPSLVSSNEVMLLHHSSCHE